MADPANVEAKLEVAKQKKSVADAAFKDGQLQAGASPDLSLHQSVTDRMT
jgi:hypothetical protein